MSKKTAEVKAVSRKDMTRWQWTWKEMKRNKVAYLMVAPYFFIFALFTVVPVVVSIFVSFTDFDNLNPPSWVGLKNYIDLFFNDEISKRVGKCEAGVFGADMQTLMSTDGPVTIVMDSYVLLRKERKNI